MPRYSHIIGCLIDDDLLALASGTMASPAGLQILVGATMDVCKISGRVYNNEVTTLERIHRDIGRSAREHGRRNILAALTLISGNVSNALEFAKWLQDIGCDVIVGGPEITPETAPHYTQLSQINGVVFGPGELIVPQIVEQGIVSGIPNLYLSGYTPKPEFRQLSWDTVRLDHSLLYDIEHHGGVSFVWGGDCHLAPHHRCYFCSRSCKGRGWRDPEQAWQELLYPYQRGLRRAYNTADTVAVNLNQLRLLAASRPDWLENLRMKCFINASQVASETAVLLKELNAVAAVGIESLTRIEAAGKGKTKGSDNLVAIQTMSDYQVPMILTFIVGLPGETHATMIADGNRLCEIVKQFGESIESVTVSPLLIALGSQAFEDLRSELKQLPRQHPDEFYNPMSMTRAYFKNRLPVSYGEVVKHICQLREKIREINPRIGFDGKGIDPEEYEIQTAA